MTEHVHEWKWTEVEVSSPLGPFTDKYYRCLKCSKKMYAHKAEARLNATEMLTAEDARRARYGYQYTDVDEALSAYANILEGKDA